MHGDVSIQPVVSILTVGVEIAIIKKVKPKAPPNLPKGEA